MKIYNLKFKEEYNNKMEIFKKIIFYLEDNEKIIKVTMYNDKEVYFLPAKKFMNNIKNKNEINFFELVFNKEFIDILINSDPKLVTFNVEEYVNIFEKFKKEIEHIINISNLD